MISEDSSKTASPPYGSFRTLIGFANDVREGGHVPLQIDRTLMPKASGSAVFETIAALKFFGLAEGEKTVKPTPEFERFVMASDSERPEVLNSLMHRAYSFLLGAPGFDIGRASGQQVIDLFRMQGLSGSTVARAISFFLAAAKDAGLKVSHNVKPPAKTSNGKSKKEKKLDVQQSPKEEQSLPEPDAVPEGTHRFEIPIPGKPSVMVVVPESLDADDWEMLSQMFGLYVARWKRYPIGKPTSVGAADD